MWDEVCLHSKVQMMVASQKQLEAYCRYKKKLKTKKEQKWFPF